MTALDRCVPSHNLITRVLLSELHRALVTIDQQREQIRQLHEERERYAREVFGRTPADD